MEATVKVEGRRHLGDSVMQVGTGFFVAQPATTAGGETVCVVLLVTARHVVDSIGCDSAYVHMRRRLPDGSYRRFLESIEIRRRGIPVWTSHPDPSVDVAVLSPELYSKASPPFVPTDAFATDDELRFWRLGPGDEVRCLGYPLGAEGEQSGFPILRGGLIASYPILPSRAHPIVQFDFEVYPGNSGGPVYLVESLRPDSLNNVYKGPPVQMVLGLVSQMYFSPPSFKPQTEIKLGGYVPAAFIQETVGRYLHDNGLRVMPVSRKP